MALVAGGVALSLVINTPSNAQAFVAPIPPPVIFGATEMVLPELMAVGSVLGPVGWTIVGLTALGVGLYATKDYWMPYVTGDFGAPKTAREAPAGTTGILPGFRLAGLLVSGTGNRSMTIAWTYTGGGSQLKSVHVHTDAYCRQDVAQTGKPPVGGIWIMPFDWAFSVSSSLTSGNISTTNMCSTNSTMVGVRAATSPTQNYNGPENENLWGTPLM
jgi:hypothetical protein